MGDLIKGEIFSQNDSQSESPTTESSINKNEKKHALATHLEPTRHPRTSRKVHNWKIQINKPILIIGHTNLSRIPQFKDVTVQVDSFPGATFYHIRGVLEKLGTIPEVKKVVLSAGVNNCLAKQTSMSL